MLTHAVLQQALQRLSDMASLLPASSLHPHAISNIANALARADVRHERLLHKLGAAVLATLGGRSIALTALHLLDTALHLLYAALHLLPI